MIFKKALLLLFILTFSSMVFSQKTVPFPEILNPSSLVVGDEYIYVVENTTIYIYSLNNFKLIKRFGKKGEGPGEFPIGRHFRINMINITPMNDKIAINSMNKMMFFSKDGQFLSEKKVITGFGSGILPFGNRYVGMIFSGFRGEEPSQAICLYNVDLKKVKEIYKRRLNMGGMGMMGNRSAKINEFASAFGYTVGNGKIYLFDSQDFIIRVFNSNGGKDAPIKVDYQPVKISSERKVKIMEYYKNVRFRNFWDSVKNRIEFPDRFPAIQSLHVKDGKIYVQTYKKEVGKSEFFIFTPSHSLGKISMLPLKEANAIEYQPYCIKSSKLYQLIENEEEEEWILYINDI